jgi:hypothetical protein
VKRPPYGSLGLPAGPVVGVPVEIVVPVTGPIVVVGFPVGTTIGDGSLPPLLGAGVAAETVKEGMLHSASQQYLPFGQSAGLPLGHRVSALQFSSASKCELPQNAVSNRSPLWIGLPVGGPVVGVPVKIGLPIGGPVVVVGFPVGTKIGDGSLPPLVGAGVAAETVKAGMLHSTTQQYPSFGQSAGLPLGHCVSGLQFSSASKYELPQNVMSIRLPIGGPVMDSGVATVPSSMSAMLQPTDQQYPPFGQSVGLPLGQCLSALQLSSAS